jgi:hypothetical protein
MEKKENKKSNAGRPTKLTKTLTLKIRKLFLAGEKIIDIQKKLEIKSNTWDSWYYADIQGFRTKLISWRREKMYQQAEINLEEFVAMPTEVEEIQDSNSEDGAKAIVVTDPKLLKIKLDATTYITDTIGKDVYSKRVIQEDPNGAKKTEVDAVRVTLKQIMSKLRVSHQTKGSAKDKMAAAVKSK